MKNHLDRNDMMSRVTKDTFTVRILKNVPRAMADEVASERAHRRFNMANPHRARETMHMHHLGVEEDGIFRKHRYEIIPSGSTEYQV